MECGQCGVKLRPAIAPLIGIGVAIFFVYVITSLIVPGLASKGGAWAPLLLIFIVGSFLPLEIIRD
jgi:hypothetical protein